MRQVTKRHLYHLLVVSDYYVMYRQRAGGVIARAYPVALCLPSCGGSNRSMKGIFKELFNILSFFKIQICVHILPCVYHIFIVMINQIAKVLLICQKIKIEQVIPKLFCPHNSFVYTFKMAILIIQNISNIICHFTLTE